MPFDFVGGESPFVRGQQYCVRLELGGASENYPLGELDYAYVTAATVTTADSLRPSVVASWTLSHATGVDVRLVKDAFANAIGVWAAHS